MKWRTSISTHKGGNLYIHGRKLLDLIPKLSFSEAIFFVLQGKMPTKRQTKMLDSILTAMIEHGVEAPSSFVARTSASVGNSFHAALAAGILATGEFHGGAIEKCAYFLTKEAEAKTLVGKVLKKGERMPGFGHKLYKQKDPRTEAIFREAKTLGFYGTYVKRALAVQKELESETHKKLPLNIDGAVAALLLELGFDWRLGKAFFVLARLPGLIAHVHEEMINEKPYRRLEESDVEYAGPNA